MITKNKTKKNWVRDLDQDLISKYETFTLFCLLNLFIIINICIQSNDNKNRHTHKINWIKKKLYEVAHISKILFFCF